MVSALARRLLHCLAEGLLPATEVQALAAAAWEDGCSWARYLHTCTHTHSHTHTCGRWEPKDLWRRTVSLSFRLNVSECEFWFGDVSRCVSGRGRQVLSECRLQISRLTRWGRDDDLARRLARCGCGGARTGHVLQSMLRAANLAGLMSSLARPYLAEVEGKDRQPMVVRVFLPHEGLYELVGNKPLAEWTLPPEVLAEETGLGGLVKKWAAHPDVTSHPAPEDVIAIGLHADGVQYTTTMRAGGAKSVFVISWNAISARALGDRAQRRLLAVLQKSKLCDCGCQGFHTFQGVWKIVAWSFRHLMLGYAPSRRHDDSPFSREDTVHRIEPRSNLPKAAMLQLRGDWEWFVQCFRFRTPSQERFCWLCDAEKSTGDLYAYDFSLNAPFRSTLITHETYLCRCAAEQEQPCELFQALGVRLEHVCIDSMHSADLGVFADALGSIMELEIACRAFHSNRHVGLERLNDDLTQFYRAHPGLSQVTLSSCRRSSPPRTGTPF